MTSDIPNAEAARLYSLERLVAKTPESSVQMTRGCFLLYRSAALSFKLVTKDVKERQKHQSERDTFDGFFRER